MSRALGICLRFLLAMMLATAAAVMAVPTARAAGQADLQVSLAGPSRSSPSAGFRYTITASNLGPSAADGARVDFTAPAGATGVTAACEKPVGGTACGNFVVSGGRASGTLVKLPGNGGATITITGAFGTGSSATATATISTPGGVTELNPSSNTSTQNTALAQAIVDTTTTLPPATVESGSEVVITTTFENVGTVAVRNFALGGRFITSAGVGGPERYAFRGTTSCAETSDIPCPQGSLGNVASNDSSLYTDFPFEGGRVDLAPGQKVVFTTTVTVTRSCDTGGVTQMGRALSLYGRYQTTVDNLPYEVQGRNSSESYLFISGGKSRCMFDLRVTKSVDKKYAASGEERTFTVTVENPNDEPATVAALKDTMWYDNYRDFKATGAVSCSPESTAPCPEGVSAISVSNDGFTLQNLQLPANSQLVLSVPLTFSASCRTGELGYNAASVLGVRVGGQSGANAYRSADFGIGDLPDCARPQLDLVAQRTSPEVVPSGQDSTDRVVITNGSSGTAENVNLQVYPTQTPQGFSSFLNRELTCVQSESTGDCSSFKQSSDSMFTFDLGAGEQLVLNSTQHIRSTGVCPVGDPGQYITNYSFNYDSQYRVATTEQKVACNDVAVETSVPTVTPEAGSKLPITATVSNEAGIAWDVQFSLVVPANGYVFDPGAGDSFSCEVVSAVSTQNVMCPQLSYDAQTRAFSGVIPALGTGDSIRIRVNGSAGVVEGRSYPITTTVKATGDTAVDSNTSVVNFGVANTLVPTFGEVTVNLPAGASLDRDLVFPAQMVCKSSGTTDAEVRVPAGSATGRVSLDETVWRNDDCVVTFQRPEAPAGFEWDGDFSENPVTLSAVQAGATARAAVSLRVVVPVPSPSVTGEPSPGPTSPEPSATPTDEPTASPEPTSDPTSPVPSPSATDEPSTEPTSSAPGNPSPTGPVPDPSQGFPVGPGTPGAGSGDGVAGPGGPGDTPSGGAGGVDVRTGFDRVVSDSRTWWVVAGLAVLGGVAGVSAVVLRRRSSGR